MSCQMKEVYDYLSHKKYPKKARDSEKRSLRKRVENFLIKDGVLYYCQGWMHMTEDERKTVKLRETVWTEEQKLKQVMAIHTSDRAQHLGHQKLMQKLSRDYYWVGMHADVRRILKLCHICGMKREVVMDVDYKLEEESNEGETSVDKTGECSLDNSDMLDNTTDVLFDENAFSSQAREFWEEIEVKILGPYPVNPDSDNKYFVAVFVDVFSVWTEMFVMENKDLASLILAIFTLISRRGVMKTIINKGSVWECTQLEKVLNLFSNEDCPVQVQQKPTSSLSSFWKSLQSALEDFIVNLPNDWFRYIEFFLLPFRASRAEHKDNTASYLSTSREMRLPASISHQSTDEHRELFLTKTQIHESVSAFKNIFFSSVGVCEEIGDEAKETNDENSIDSDDVSDDDETALGDGEEGSKSDKRGGRKKSETMSRSSHSYHNFYEDLLGYLQGRGYPPDYNEYMRRHLRKVSSNFLVINEDLFHKGTNGDLRETVINEDCQWKLLLKTHVSSEGKHWKVREMNSQLSPYYWRGMVSDIKAFIKACPICQKGPVMFDQNSSEVTEPLDDTEAAENNADFEDCTEEFKPIIAYLKTKTLPANVCEPKAELAFRTKANMFVLETDDSLYYLTSTYVDKSGARKKRKVIFTPEEKRTIVAECHIVSNTGEHKTKALTHSNISLYYYWPHMSREVARYLRNCPVCNIDITSNQPSACDGRVVSPRNNQVTTPRNSQVSTPNNSEEPMSSENQEVLPVAENSTPVSSTRFSSRSRKRTLEYAEYEEDNSKRNQKTKQMRTEDERIEKFKIRFSQKNAFDIKEDIHTDHGYSSQPTNTHLDLENLERIAGNEVEIETDNTLEKRRQEDLHVPENDSSLQVLMEVVESAKLAENALNVASESNESPVVDGSPGGKKNNRLNQKYKCTECGLLTGGPVKLKLHMSTHTGQKPFSCETCHSKFTTMRSVRQHQLKHSESAQIRKFLCDTCGLEFRALRLLRNHKETVHRKTYPCKHCDVIFPTKSLAIQHEKSCGGNSEGMFCQICSTYCASKSEFRAHVLNHVGLETRESLQRIDLTSNPPQIEEMSAEDVTPQEEMISVQIEIPQDMHVGDGESNTVVITESGENAEHTMNSDAHQSLIQLAEQVVKARLESGQNVQYQIVCGEDSDQIVILPVQEENS